MPVRVEMRSRSQGLQQWSERLVPGPSGGPSALGKNSTQPQSKMKGKLDRQAQPKPGSLAKRRKVGLLEHTGGGNLGDDATVAAVLENLRSRWPEAEICAFSMNTEDTEQRHGIPAYPVRRYAWSHKKEPSRGRPTAKESIKAAILGYPRLLKLAAITKTLVKGPRAVLQEIAFLSQSFRALRTLDLLLISGGGQLTEAWGGPWAFPYTLFKWGLLARLCRVKCYYINVGAGPLEHPLSSFFVNRALRLADYVSFRDEDSRALVRKLGYRKNAEVAPDCAYSLNITATEGPGEGPAAGPVVGFSPMAYCDPRVYWDKNQQTYERMRENLVRFGSWLIGQNCQLRLFSTDIWFDATALEEVEAGLRRPGTVAHPEWVVRERAGQVQELIARIGEMDCVVTCRFHGVIFAHIMGKPVLALSHHPKVATLMRSLGLAEYCIDMRDCDATVLQEKFSLLMRNREAIAAQMRESLAGYRTALTRQFDALFERDE